MRIAIIDYKMSNLFSVKNVFDVLGEAAYITSDPWEIENSDAAVLPGVGAFGDAMKHLTDLGLDECIKNYVESRRPLMGVCLGMQLLFDRSEEFGNTHGLGLIEGDVVRFTKEDRSSQFPLRVPHMGWNQIRQPESNSDLWQKSPLANIPPGSYMYFVHSYYVVPKNCNIILSTTRYGKFDYCSSLYSDNIFAVQFHPEKSANIGIHIYQTWVDRVKQELKVH